MAREKKKEILTPEERLHAALVPESEQPYKVPENWCWVTLSSTASIIMGQSPSGIDTTEDSQYTPLIGGAADMGDTYPKATRYTKIPTKVSTNQDLILCIRATLGKPVYSDKEYCLGRGVAAIRPHIGDRSFYKYFFNAFEQYLYDNATGTTFAQVSSKTLQQMPLPLPPLSEQQRIVDRIESLFAKLDEAKQKAQDALDSFETRKAAILHKAFTGELTAQWRKEHGVGMESWRRIPLKKCGSWYGGGTPSMRHPEYWENGTLLWITSKDMKNDLIEDTLMHVNMLGVENSSANYIEEPAVLFVMRSGILRRTFPVCMVKKSFTVNQDLKALVPVDDISLEYLFWGCKANEKQILEKCMKSGTTVESINSTALRDFEIPIAGSSEQSEIVRIIDNLLAKEQQAKESAERVLGQIDLIKKAVLARAFRGELGTNDPNEESAVELVKRVIERGE